MATQTKPEPIDLYDMLKHTVFPKVTVPLDGESICASLAYEKIKFVPGELTGALARLLADGYLRLVCLQAPRGFGTPTYTAYSIGFERTDKLTKECRSAP